MIMGTLGAIGIFMVLVLGWLAWEGSREAEEKEDLKKGIIKVMKKLKPKQNIFIHYGNGKQLSFVGGERQ